MLTKLLQSDSVPYTVHYVQVRRNERNEESDDNCLIHPPLLNTTNTTNHCSHSPPPFPSPFLPPTHLQSKSKLLKILSSPNAASNGDDSDSDAESVDPSDLPSYVLINCGSTIPLPVPCYVIDSLRPFNLRNVYSEDVYIVAGELETRDEADEYLSQGVGDGDYLTDGGEDEDTDEEDGVSESEGEEEEEEDQDDGEEEADFDDVEGRSEKKRKPNPQGEEVEEGEEGDQAAADAEADDAEEKEEEQEDIDPIKSMRSRRERIISYYNQGSCHSYPTSYVLLHLTASSRFSGDSGMLWMAMVGSSSCLQEGKIDVEGWREVAAGLERERVKLGELGTGMGAEVVMGEVRIMTGQKGRAHCNA